jgi:hypothetical protein
MKPVYALFCTIILAATIPDVLADAPAIGISTEPATILVNYKDNHTSAHVIISTMKTTGLPALYLRAGPAKFGDINATISFPGNAARDFIYLPATTSQKEDVPIDVSGIDVPGTYTATLDLALQGEGSTLLSTKAEIVRASSTFSPTVGGPAMKNGQLELSVNSNTFRTTFSLQNPPTSRARDFRIVINPPLDKYLKAIPDTIRVSSGDQREIILAVQNALPLGPSIGTVDISDVEDPNLIKQLIINVTRTLNFWTATIIIFGLVLAGSVLSVVLNNVFPVSLTRFKNRGSLTDIENGIGACTGASGFLQSALLAEAARLRLLNGAFSWYTTSKGEQIKALADFLSILKSRLEITERISGERIAVAQSTRVSVGVGAQIEERLTAAEDALLDGRVDNAKTLLDEATNLRATTNSPNVIVALRADLTAQVSALIAAAGNPTNRPEVITNILKSLGQALPGIPTMPVDQLLLIDKHFNAARVYIEDFEPAAQRKPSLNEFANQFAAIVKSDVASQDTRLLTSLIQNELLPTDVAKAITVKAGRIECASEVHPYQIETFQFEFNNPVIKHLVAARHLCKYEWIFGDDSKAPTYDRCNHFFMWEKSDDNEVNSSIFVKAKKVVRKWLNVGDADVTLPKFSTRTVSVKVTAPYDPEISQTFPQTIKLLPKARHGKAAVGIQVTTFAISFIVAVFAAFGAQYGTIPALDSLSAWMTPFLFGFSLDQIRDKTLVTTR